MPGRTQEVRLCSAAILVLFAAGCREKPSEPAPAKTSKNDVSAPQRKAALAAARVWIAPKVPIGSADFKLICPAGAERPDGSCRAPVAAIKDLGATFGPKRVDLANWKKLPVWTDPASCRVSMKTLPFEGATFEDAQISEDGRQFALTLLRSLTRPQLNTLFEASGVTTFRRVLGAVHEPQAWTAAFLAKVDQIASAGPCPSAAGLKARGA